MIRHHLGNLTGGFETRPHKTRVRPATPVRAAVSLPFQGRVARRAGGVCDKISIVDDFVSYHPGNLTGGFETRPYKNASPRPPGHGSPGAETLINNTAKTRL